MVELELMPPAEFFNDEVRGGYHISKQMKEVWAIQIDLLNKLLDVCRKYDIEIAASSGTLLGAVRDQGFIPWDDDIDMQITRDNFDKLCSVASKEFKEPYFFQTEATDPGTLRGHGQLRNSRTTAILKCEEGKAAFNQGIFIDLFVIDQIPDDPALCAKQDKLIKRYKKNASRMYRYGMGYRFCEKGLKERIKHVFCSFIGLFADMDYWYKKMEDLCTGNNKNDYKRCGCISAYAMKKNFIWDREVIRGVMNMKFEYIQIPVNRNYDIVLKTAYGDDYMTPRKAPTLHGDVIFDTDRPYTEYIK